MHFAKESETVIFNNSNLLLDYSISINHAIESAFKFHDVDKLMNYKYIFSFNSID